MNERAVDRWITVVVGVITIGVAAYYGEREVSVAIEQVELAKGTARSAQKVASTAEPDHESSTAPSTSINAVDSGTAIRSKEVGQSLRSEDTTPPTKTRTEEDVSDQPTPKQNMNEIERKAEQLYGQKEYKNAEEMFQQACDSAIGPACYRLAWLYGPHLVTLNLQGFNHQILSAAKLSGDPVRAAALFEKACGEDVAQACGDLAHYYVDGTGGKKDPDQAEVFRTKACSLGDKFECKSRAD